MERIATSFCSFERLVKRYTYVDKTNMLWRLVSDSEDALFFIARPRRFGKSLMLDTLKCIFEGRRELFRGLKIDKKRYDWRKYPVVMLSMDEVKGETPDQLIENLIGTVTGLVVRFGLEGVREYSSPGKYFGAFLSALAEYAGLLGYTPKEIEATYPKRLDALAKKLKTDRKGALGCLLNWYDSYRFCPESTVRVCNPISIANALETRVIRNYWAKTASASLVMERIAAAGKTPDDFEGCTSTVDELDVCDALELPAKALMYQSGYLTIKKVVGEANGIDEQKLILGIPNQEVRTAIRAGWFDHFVKIPSSEFEALVDVAKKQVAAGDLHELVGESYIVLQPAPALLWKDGMRRLDACCRISEKREEKRYEECEQSDDCRVLRASG